MSFCKNPITFAILASMLASSSLAEPIPFAVYNSLVLQEASSSHAVLTGVYAEGPWSWSPMTTADPLPGWGPGSTVLLELNLGLPSLDPQTRILTVPSTGRVTFTSHALDNSVNGTLVLENAGAQRFDLNANNAVVLEDVGHIVVRAGGPLLNEEPTFTITKFVEATGVFENIRIIEGAQEIGTGLQVFPRIPGLDLQSNLINVPPTTLVTQGLGTGMYELVPEPPATSLAVIGMIWLASCFWRTRCSV